jgi:outer membrane receptor for ferric coprogen and ferric-rhodotorulic acid
MALFEAVRGADGMMTGNPSATINYIRKRPTKDSAPMSRRASVAGTTCA